MAEFDGDGCADVAIGAPGATVSGIWGYGQVVIGGGADRCGAQVWTSAGAGTEAGSCTLGRRR